MMGSLKRWCFAALLVVLSVTEVLAEGKVVRVYTGTLNVNTASAADFARLPGVGEVIGYRIVKAREDRGSYRDIRELKRIKGVSERVYDGFRKYVTTKGDNPLKVYIDVNTVTKSVLLTLPGMSSVEARSILNYRAAYGKMSSLAELKQVPGMTPKRYQELSEHLAIAQ